MEGSCKHILPDGSCELAVEHLNKNLWDPGFWTAVAASEVGKCVVRGLSPDKQRKNCNYFEIPLLPAAGEELAPDPQQTAG